MRESDDARPEDHLMSVAVAVTACLPLAVGAVLAHLPTTAVSSGLATLNSSSVLTRFTAGWLVGVAAVTAVGLLLADTVVLVSDSSAGVRWLRLFLGIGLMALGLRMLVRHVRNGPKSEEPGWVGTARGLTGGRAFATAFLLGSVNPKSAVIALSAASVIVEAAPAVAVQLTAAAVFVAVSSLGVAAPALALLVFRDRARTMLAAFVGGFVKHSDTVLIVVLLALGLHVILGTL